MTERLASLYIEQNLNDRENQADSTSQFLGRSSNMPSTG